MKYFSITKPIKVKIEFRKSIMLIAKGIDDNKCTREFSRKLATYIPNASPFEYLTATS